MEDVAPDKTWISSEVGGLQLHAPGGTILELTKEMMEVDPLNIVLECKIFDRDLAKHAACTMLSG